MYNPNSLVYHNYKDINMVPNGNKSLNQNGNHYLLSQFVVFVNILTTIRTKVYLFVVIISVNNNYRTKKYEEAYRRSLDDPEGFWAEVGTVVDWYKPWDKVLDNTAQPLTDW